MNKKIELLKEQGNDMDNALYRLMNDEELLIECLNMFVEDENIVLLEKSIKEKDVKASFEYAHCIKGVAGNLGLTKIYELDCQMTETFRAGRLDGAEEQIIQLKEYFEEFKNTIK